MSWKGNKQGDWRDNGPTGTPAKLAADVLAFLRRAEKMLQDIGPPEAEAPTALI